jgi:hypothetical protein
MTSVYNNIYNKISGVEVLEFASRTNKNIAAYLLRSYGMERFDGTQKEYMELMKYLLQPEKQTCK